MATLKSLVDETTNIKNELVKCYSNLKSNLISKGVECSESDKISILINKINGITLGKKWASGIGLMSTSTTSYTYYGGSGTKLCYTMKSSNLDFNPKYVIAYFNDGIRVHNVIVIDDLMISAQAPLLSSTTNNGISALKYKSIENGFIVGCDGNGIAGNSFNWVAFE